jgi:hypothetical protein
MHASVLCGADGRGFHLLGLVMWAPLCGSIHWLNNQLQPAAAIGGMLASKGLLDLPQQQQQQDGQFDAAAAQQVAAAQAAADIEQQQLRRFEELSYREKKQAVEMIRQREIAELNEALKQQQLQEAAKAAGQGSSSSSGEGAQSKRRWWPFS